MQDPYPLLAEFREAGPVHEVVFAHGAKAWLVTGYDEVRALVNDPRVSKDGRRMNELFARHSEQVAGEAADQAGGGDRPADDGHGDQGAGAGHGERAGQDDKVGGVGFDDDLAAHMLNSDPPRHTRLRALVSKAFTAQRVEQLRPRVAQVADRLLDALQGQDEVDLMDRFAIRLPITIICDLFGLPEADREDFRQWSLKLVGAGQDPDEVADASKRMVDYANALIDAKRTKPGDDMISELVRVSEDGDRLSQGELVSMIFVLVVAGHITTIYSIGNAVAALLTHPDQLARLQADPSLMPAAVDELLRFDGPSGVGTFRFTTDDIPIGGSVIPAGQILALSWHAANRDGSHFADPDRLDLGRRPVGGLSFGHGIHYCIGVPLAKMQIEIALGRLITRYPSVRLAVDPAQLRRDDSALLRGLLALPVRVSPV
jgi:cytochrome P450